MTNEEFFKLSFTQQVEIVDEYTTQVDHCSLADNYELYIYRFGNLFLKVLLNPYLEIEQITRYEKE
jgi:hypothetical protein